MELFYEYTYGLTIFAKKFHHRCSTGLYIGLRKYWNFQREAKLEQIIAIVTTHGVFLLMTVFKFETLISTIDSKKIVQFNNQYFTLNKLCWQCPRYLNIIFRKTDWCFTKLIHRQWWEFFKMSCNLLEILRHILNFSN